jgi:hypothetical protein
MKVSYINKQDQNCIFPFLGLLWFSNVHVMVYRLMGYFNFIHFSTNGKH